MKWKKQSTNLKRILKEVKIKFWELKGKGIRGIKLITFNRRKCIIKIKPTNIYHNNITEVKTNQILLEEF